MKCPDAAPMVLAFLFYQWLKKYYMRWLWVRGWETGGILAAGRWHRQDSHSCRQQHMMLTHHVPSQLCVPGPGSPL